MKRIICKTLHHKLYSQIVNFVTHYANLFSFVHSLEE